MSPVMRFLIRVAVVALAVLAAGALFPDQIQVKGGVEQILVFAVVLGLLNAFVRPVLVLFTLPINLLTLGLFTLVINALLFWAAANLLPGVEVTGFVGAFVGALTVSVVSFLASRFSG